MREGHTENALQAVAEALGNRVRPLSLARDRVLPVHPVLAGAFPEGGLRRGSVVACQGQAAWSAALALCGSASQAGSWVGWVNPGPSGSFGLAAASEWGIALERVLSVPAVAAAQLPTVLAAVIDGVDLVVVGAAGVRAGDARRLGARLTQRGGVLLVVGDPGGFVPDLVCTVSHSTWTGLGEGHGRLRSRRVRFETSGRRAERPRRLEVWFPGPSPLWGTAGQVEPVGKTERAVPVDATAPVVPIAVAV